MTKFKYKMFNEKGEYQRFFKENKKMNESLLFTVESRESGDVFETVPTYKDAEKIIAKFERDDERNDTYEPNYYEIGISGRKATREEIDSIRAYVYNAYKGFSGNKRDFRNLIFNANAVRSAIKSSRFGFISPSTQDSIIEQIAQDAQNELAK